MSDRNRRRFVIGIFAAMTLLFLGGTVAFLVDFRHHTICPGGAQWISRTDNGIGTVEYVCPSGKTVTEGILP
jgi:hypothetical protein